MTRGRVVLLLAAVVCAAGLVLYRLWRPEPAALRLRSVPPGVRVIVDGTFAGTTPDTGLVLSFAEAGSRRLKLERPGYRPDTSTVTLRSGEHVDLEVVMRVPGMRFVRGGRFQMGDPDGDYNERPVHAVVVRPFYMDRTEVTVRAFRQFNTEYAPAFGGEDMPATGVSWPDADAFCRSRGKRLPTEAEWERACRGARGSRYSYGKAHDPGKGRTGADLKSGPAQVGSYPPGSGGLLDMTGNVWEWCADWYGRDAYRRATVDNPAGPESGAQHVLRGGAWYSNARYARCAHRPGDVRMAWHSSFGFRCVRDLD